MLRDPPAGSTFEFHYEESFPVALAILADDARLTDLRFQLVPKKCVTVFVAV